MIGSQRYRATALAEASRCERLMTRFPGFEQMAFFAGAYWEYSWRETGITNGKIDPEDSGMFRVELSSPIDSATTASRKRASAAARTLRHESGLRLIGIRRRTVARLRDRAKSRSSSERLVQDESAGKGARSYPGAS